MTLEEKITPELLATFDKAGLAITLRVLKKWIQGRNKDSYKDVVWYRALEFAESLYIDRYKVES